MLDKSNIANLTPDERREWATALIQSVRGSTGLTKVQPVIASIRVGRDGEGRRFLLMSDGFTEISVQVDADDLRHLSHVFAEVAGCP